MQAYPGDMIRTDPAKLNVLILGRHTKRFYQDHSTVRLIAGLDFVNVVFKSRPRVVVPRKVYEMVGYNSFPSARLIQWADVVICSISSVILDVLYYDKPLV
jgi:hypothetical protein